MELSNKFKFSLHKHINKSLNKTIYNQSITNNENTKDESKLFKRKLQQSNLPFYKNNRFEIEYDSIKHNLIKGIKKIKINDNKKKEYQIEKKRNNKKDNKTISRNYILIKVLNAILINILFCQIKSKTLDIFYFKNDFEIILRIKGKGESKFLGDLFYNIDDISNVLINGIVINHEENVRRFNFGLENNTVKLIFNKTIDSCYHMFSGCSNITEIDLSQFDSSNVESMVGMFEDCTSLSSLDLSNLETSNVENMYYMFRNCLSLSSINLTNINTSKVYDMGDLFKNCFSLTSLDLSNFDTSNAGLMDNMFSGCVNLTFLNLSNFNTSKVTLMENMFESCYSLTSLDLSNFNTLTVEDMENMFYDCFKLEYINLNVNNNFKNDEIEFDNHSNNIDICLNNDVNIVKEIFSQLNNKSCFILDCSDDLNPSDQDNVFSPNNECIENDNYNTLIPSEIIIKLYENCDNEYPLNHVLCAKCNFNNSLRGNEPLKFGIHINNNCYSDLKNKCYYTCNNNCYMKGDYINHKCKECNEHYTIEFKHSIFYNCYNNCSNEDNKCYENLTQIIEKEFTEFYNTINLDNGQDEIIQTEKMIFTFTALKNQKNKIQNNLPAIDLDECESLLRNQYTFLNLDNELYIKKIDIIQEETKAKKVQYDVYFKRSDRKLEKLNLTICMNSTITIYIPTIVTGDVNKYNISSGYYHDICYTTTSEDGTDLTLKERQDIYLKDYINACPENCEFSGFTQAGAAKCSCDFKETSSSIVDFDFHKIENKKLFKNFKDIKNSLNIKILICYRKIFTKNGISNNKGAYIIGAIIFYHLISNIALCITKSKRNKKVKDIAVDLYISHRSIKTRKELKSNKDKSKSVFLKKEENLTKIKCYKKITSSNSKLKKIHKESKKTLNLNQTKKDNNKKELKKLNDDEINELPYNSALIYDKRPMFDYYVSLLKTKHNLLCIFNSSNCDSRLIKIDLLFIGFAINYAINALFYNDVTMHKIHVKKGEYDIETQLPIIIYSFLITIISNAPINYFALSNEEIISIKQNITNINEMKKEKCLKRKLTAKLCFYIIISFLLLAFIWYYVSIFCVIYRNTQMHLLKDSISYFGISLFTPCAFYLLPGFFRVPSLSNKKNNRKCLYEFSKVLQLLCEYI